MFRKGKAVARSDPDGEEERERSVILLSSSDEDEANGDLSLEIVNRAREREEKRKREEDRAELEKRESQASRRFLNLSSSSSDEIEVTDHEKGGDWQSSMVPKKRKKSRKRKKKKVEDIENDINAAKLEWPLPTVEAVGSQSAEVSISVVECRERLATSEMSNGEAVSSEVARELANSGKAEESSFSVETVGPGVGDTANDIKAEAGSPVVDITDPGVGLLDNSVLRKLLRGPRYFDPPESHCDTCYNCGKEGHTAAVCTSEKRKKPCFVCGNHGHGAKHCTQGQDCFLCKRRGHVAKNCPEKGQVGFQNSKFCLLCGDFGHDMSTCKNDYTPEDLKDVQCYICRKYGHLCCADIDADSVEASCYNCGQSGHSGSGCAKLWGEMSGTAALSCFKCGEEGHFARGCTKSVKSAWTSGETSKSAKKLRKDELKGSKSVPPDVEKAHRKIKKPYEERKSMSAGKKPRWRDGWAKNDPGDLPNGRSPGKHRQRGGWIPDDIGDLPGTLSPKKPKRRGGWIPEDPVDTPYERKKKGISWDSPAPARWPDNTRTPPPVTHGWHPRSYSPFKKQNMQSGSPGSHTWARPSPNGLAASRFGSNARKTHWRG